MPLPTFSTSNREWPSTKSDCGHTIPSLLYLAIYLVIDCLGNGLHPHVRLPHLSCFRNVLLLDLTRTADFEAHIEEMSEYWYVVASTMADQG